MPAAILECSCTWNAVALAYCRRGQPELGQVNRWMQGIWQNRVDKEGTVEFLGGEEEGGRKSGSQQHYLYQIQTPFPFPYSHRTCMSKMIGTYLGSGGLLQGKGMKFPLL